jgi:hypothetical protein
VIHIQHAGKRANVSAAALKRTRHDLVVLGSRHSIKFVVHAREFTTVFIKRQTHSGRCPF